MAQLDISFEDFYVVGEIKIAFPKSSVFLSTLKILSSLSRTLVYHTLYMFLLTGAKQRPEDNLPEGVRLRDIRKIDVDNGEVILSIEIPVEVEGEDLDNMKNLGVNHDYQFESDIKDIKIPLKIVDVIPAIAKALVLTAHWDEARGD